MVSVIIAEQFELPDVRSLADFRRWTASDEFPESGRIDYVAGRIEVDVSPEEYHAHGAVKVELIRVLAQIVKEEDLGELFSDRARTASVPAELSAEPDVLFLSHGAIESGRVQFIPKAGEVDRFVEVEGGPDLVAEIVSDNSVSKDTRRLPAAYFAAGVEEYWLIDARGEALLFCLHRRGEGRFEPVEADADGFQHSAVLARRFSLRRRRNRRGHWTYDLLATGV